MSLGRREARHETVASARTAGVTPEDYWDFKPGQKVMTADGFPGVVASVDDGPIAGTETYLVTLDNGMGGGQYTASLLRAMPQSTANVDVKTAADDYPELGTILVDRPPLQISTAAALQTEAQWTPATMETYRNAVHHGFTNARDNIESGRAATTNHSRASREDEGGKMAEMNGHAPGSEHHGVYARGYADGHEATMDPDAAQRNGGVHDLLKHWVSQESEPDRPGHLPHLKSTEAAHKEAHDANEERPSVEAECQREGCGRPQVPGATVCTSHMGTTAAYDHGDPSEYTSGHKCPNCASDRSLESANGVIKCEDCGYEEQNGQTDGWGKAASLDDPYRMIFEAVADSEFRFHVTASYADVRSKAKRLRAAGGVNIISAQGGTVVANVKGDTAVYETEIVRMGSNAIQQWHCGCKWGSYAWGRQPSFKKFEGRLCSHALALHFEAQSQGMFGRTIQEEEKAPGWLKPRTRVVTDFDKDQRRNVSRPAQPRKRDVMRSYAKYVPTESPVEVLVAFARAEGISDGEILLSLAVAGIDALAFVDTDPEPPKSHHKDRSGDLAPCSRGGCGHPEGIHGEEGGDCTSAGCDCPHFQRVGAPKEARRKKKHQHHKHPSGRAHGNTSHEFRRHPSMSGSGYGAWWHGIGYGYGIGGWGGAYSPGESGGDGGDGGGDGGGSEGARGIPQGVLRNALATAFPVDTMDPTYTEGNEPRHHDEGQGIWHATRPPYAGDNPAQMGWATTSDPKEFDVDSSAFGRMGSLQELPTFAFEAKGEGHQKDWWNPFNLDNVREFRDADWSFWSLTEEQKAKNRAAYEQMKDPDFKPRVQEGAAGPAALLGPVVKGLTPVVKNVADDIGKAVTKPRTPVKPRTPAKPATPTRPKPGRPPNKPGKPGPKTPGRPQPRKPLPDDLPPKRPVVPQPRPAPAPAKPVPTKPVPTKPVPTKPQPRKPIPDDLPPKRQPVRPAPAPAPKPVTKPQPRIVPDDLPPKRPTLPSIRPATKPAPQPKPGSPGTPNPKVPGAPRPMAPGVGTGANPGHAPGAGRAPGTGSGTSHDPVPHKPPVGPPTRPPVSNPGPKVGPRGPLPIPPLPGLWAPDYYRESDALKAQRGIGRGASLVADLLRQEAALTDQERYANGVADKFEALGGGSLPRYTEADEDLNAIVQQEGIKDRYRASIDVEAELHDEPEAALPSTDGADPDREVDPDGDVEGMASHGTLQTTAWDREEWDERNDEHERDDDPCSGCGGSGELSNGKECDRCDASGQEPLGRKGASVEPEVDVSDIVARFQATAGAAALVGGGSTSPGEGGSDVAAAAREFLAKESMKTFAPHEQKEIIDEGVGVTASNLDRLNIEGTHYEALEAALASQTDDDDLEL